MARVLDDTPLSPEILQGQKALMLSPGKEKGGREEKLGGYVLTMPFVSKRYRVMLRQRCTQNSLRVELLGALHLVQKDDF